VTAIENKMQNAKHAIIIRAVGRAGAWDGGNRQHHPRRRRECSRTERSYRAGV